MRIAISCDHIVTDIKNEVRDTLIKQGYEVIDMGTYDYERTHYPIYGQKVGEMVVKNIVDYGIVICGTGVGISIGAQKVQGVRTALVGDVQTAINAREQYNANVLGMGGRVSGIGLIMDIVTNFLNTEYHGENKELIEIMNSRGHEQIVNFDDELEKWNQGFYHD